MLAAPLATAAASVQSKLQQWDTPSQPVSTDRLAYPALSALVTACQISTARAVEDSAQAEEFCAPDAFQSFWNSAVIRQVHALIVIGVLAGPTFEIMMPRT